MATRVVSDVLRIPNIRPVVDVFCGMVEAGVWPFAEPLVIEIEVERGSYLVQDVHTNAPLPGLQRYLRQSIRGLPVGRLLALDNGETQGAYKASYWKWVNAALIFAAASFREEHFSDYFASLTDPITGLEQRVSA